MDYQLGSGREGEEGCSTLFFVHRGASGAITGRMTPGKRAAWGGAVETGDPFSEEYGPAVTVDFLSPNSSLH